MKKTVVITMLVICICAVSLSGCIPGPTPEKQEYDTQFPLVAHEYQLYVNKELSPLQNLLILHTSRGRDVLEGRSDKDSEIQAVDESIKIAGEIYAKLKKMYPPDDYKSDHAALLTRVSKAITALTEYNEALTAWDGVPTSMMDNAFEDSDVMQAVNAMEDAATQINLSFETYWK
jgi:hypothetical protein